MPLLPVERAVRDAIDEHELVETLRALVRIPSVTGHERAAQEWLAGRMRESGLDVDFWPIDLQAVRADPSYPGEEADRDEAYGLTGAFGATHGHGPRLILNGHIDVVPPGDRESWHVDPWSAELRDGCVFGRGACDMKGGLAAAYAAIRAVQRAGVRLHGSVELQSVVGEEEGGIGTLATLRRGHTGDAAVVVEPTELSIIPAQAGALGFSLRVPGRAAHACERLAGVSAIEKFWPLFSALERLERQRNSGVDHPLLRLQALPYPLSIGILRAGSWLSTVPDDLEAIGRYGVAIGEDLASARQELEEAVCAAAREDDWLTDHPPRVSWVGGRFAPAETAQSHPFVESAGRLRCRYAGRTTGNGGRHVWFRSAPLRQRGAHARGTVRAGGRAHRAHDRRVCVGRAGRRRGAQSRGADRPLLWHRVRPAASQTAA